MPNIWPWTGTSANANTKKHDDDPSNPWLCAGPISSFPNIVPAAGENPIELCPPPPSSEEDSTDRNPDDGSTSPAPPPLPPPCRVFSQPGADSSSASPTCTTSPSNQSPNPSTSTSTHLSPIDLDQGTSSSLLLFQYRSQIYATPYLCPHQSYPLTHASVSDIEDFGVVLSAGITCPRHGWTWDLHTGEADRGRYRLPLWEVQLRDGEGEGEGEKMVWVRRKERRRIG